LKEFDIYDKENEQKILDMYQEYIEAQLETHRRTTKLPMSEFMASQSVLSPGTIMLPVRKFIICMIFR
jgi:hypothetical protein